MIVLITEQGTACAETGLCRKHDSTAERERVKAEADSDAVNWITNVQNPAIECVVCGVTFENETNPMTSCPNCGIEVRRAKPGHSTGCVFGALLTVIEDRGELDFNAIAVEDFDTDAFWATMGNICDGIERDLEPHAR